MTGFMLTSLVALLITMTALALYERATFREQILTDVDVLAGVIGANASSSIAFNDRQAAQSTLAALKTQPHIVAAYLFDRDGKQFASYPSNAPAIPAPVLGATMGSDHLAVARAVLFNSARIGTVYLRSDLGLMVERRTRYLQLAAAVLVSALIVALLLSSAFQRAISRPILRLLDVEKRVSRETDYSLRATTEGRLWSAVSFVSGAHFSLSLAALRKAKSVVSSTIAVICPRSPISLATAAAAVAADWIAPCTG